MRNILIILGILFVILSVMFGKNPIEEAQKKRELARQGKDDLILSIEEHNSKKSNFLSGLGTSALGGSGATGNDTTAAPAPASSSNGSLSANPYRQEQSGSVAPAPSANPNQTYYPPPPLAPGQTAPAPESSPFSSPAPYEHHSFNGFYLRSGKKLEFAGIRVYTTDAKGNKIPLPDGIYPLMNGLVFLTVRDGKKMVVNN